jgi:predicted amidohydrolase
MEEQRNSDTEVKMKIALIQMNIQWEDKKENYKRAETFIKEASEHGCTIIVFPEMFNTGFSMNIFRIGEPENGETTSFLSQMAKQYRINIIAGFPIWEMNREKGRNIAAIYNTEGNVIAKFTKLHPFPLAKEDQYYIAGNDIITFTVDGMPSSIFICYDLRFPEVFRKVAKKVQAIFVIANWPTSRKDHWEALLRARAIENQCFIIGVNRTGIDGNGIDYPGASRIYDSLGNNICAGNETAEMIIGELNPREADEVRSRFSFLQDIRFIDLPS